jgi:hypothetical protein
MLSQCHWVTPLTSDTVRGPLWEASDHVLGPPGPPWRIFEALGASCEWFLKPSGALLGYSTMVLEIFHDTPFKLPPKVFLQSTGCRFPKRLGDSLGMKVILIYSILQSVPDT